MEFKKFNINDIIKVKLTDLGYQHLADLHNKFEGTYNSFKKTEAQTYKNRADKDGYTRFQMWCFLQDFGNVTSLTMRNYYDTNILIQM